MPAQHHLAAFKLDSSYTKDPKISYAYGTAGFRMKYIVFQKRLFNNYAGRK